MKIIFMGTPDFAVPSLKALIESHYDVICVVTQKDKPKGRGYKVVPTPVKEYAMSQGIMVLQPERLSREPETIEKIRELNPDLIVTCAFGQILPDSLLAIPRYGTINVHGSLLPKYRGAAPIQWAVINGETKTGITTMLTDSGLDTGDMLLKAEIDIPDDMTAGELHDRMSLLGAETLIKTLKKLEEGTLVPVPQDDSQATLAPRITRDTGRIDWSASARNIHNLIRGTTPWPGAFAFLDGQKVRIWRSAVGEDRSDTGEKPDPGTIIGLDKEAMTVQAGEGIVRVFEIQVESNKRMTPYQYSLGHELKIGMKLTPYEAE
ncbi:methionyl-tRNA formyltransferase [Thermoclostridium caenicola]|uniref:Methionyl-tRNA formyltransferase n=1 Tax=Thermoclostridium caenicola TaxID=659425 RepID=A0A1M6IQ25_9FIRM|nr:methionyl-tRNA formyltransferase [Thermoclostridium caenicola]SHJ36544.1 methionyl-tRNA formyltransferase [Thermoclostridium caenicola]HOL83862.1 methionyl-tRNA formyltransferase [Thermoclostridium caenicola]HPO76374.1 methionyl-tRNA formyltransferase [Thermoclostridium caenicola]HPU45866.1 methionyl-tRNA formyltransferase [Thermoclostridium sp.]